MSNTEYYREYRAKKEGKPVYQEADLITCLICQKKFVFVGAHVWQAHKWYMIEYKKHFKLDTKRGRTTGQFKELKNKTNKGVNNLAKGAKYRFKLGQSTNYQRSQETLDRLRKQGKKIGKIYGGNNKD